MASVKNTLAAKAREAGGIAPPSVREEAAAYAAPIRAIPVTEETIRIARGVIWFDPPEKSLADPVRLMAYAMAHALPEEMQALRRYVTDADLRAALEQAPPGIIDPRSWAYWNTYVGRTPVPPMPVRHFGDMDGPPSAGKTAFSIENFVRLPE